MIKQLKAKLNDHIVDTPVRYNRHIGMSLLNRSSFTPTERRQEYSLLKAEEFNTPVEIEVVSNSNQLKKSSIVNTQQARLTEGSPCTKSEEAQINQQFEGI